MLLEELVVVEKVSNVNDFVRLLLKSVPELRPIYIEHLEDYDEILEHVFMGEVTRFATKEFINNPNSESLHRLLSFLDKAYTTVDKNLKELISVSFLENLSGDEKCYEGIFNILSDSLKLEFLKYS